MLLKVLTDFGKVVEDYLSVGKGADATGRNSKSSYRKQKGELAGCINIALWHAIGHTVRPKLLRWHVFVLILIVRRPNQYFLVTSFELQQLIQLVHN